MSRVHATERGAIVSTLCEELTTFRRARRFLWLPATSNPAILYVLARPHKPGAPSLHLSANETEIPAVQPRAPKHSRCRWHTVTVDPQLLQPGENTFELWTATTAMDAWSFGLEPGHAQPRSYITDDGGKTWRNNKMGYLNAVSGEYVVRVRLAEGEDPPAPKVLWEDPDHPCLVSLRQLMPEEALACGPLMRRVGILSSWISSSWEHTNSLRAAQYAPWDAETILAWGRAQSGHGGQRPVVMYVHYAVMFVSCCAALRLPARCAVLKASTPGGFGGHFVAEVWSEEYEKWIMVDPTWDFSVWRGCTPLSITEIQETDSCLGTLIRPGPGLRTQLE